MEGNPSPSEESPQLWSGVKNKRIMTFEPSEASSTNLTAYVVSARERWALSKVS